METQARYTMVGLFTLVIAGAGFAFVYWLHDFAGGDHAAHYRIRFDAPVIGLRAGVAVLFNGLRVGEVTSVRFEPGDPRMLMTEIAVDRTTPVRQDTRVGVDSQGLMGSATISLTGGASLVHMKPDADGKPPLLIATADETVSLGRAARLALAQLDKILADNATPLHGIIDNLSTFADALGRNSTRVDSILAGLENMTGGGPPKPRPLSYTLSAPEFPPRAPPLAKAMASQIALAEPTALVAFQTQKLLISPKPQELTPLEAGQWADSAPNLVQSALAESFENAGFAHVSKATDGFTPDLQLLLEIRSFEVSTGPPATARVAIFAKLLGTDGKISAERDFRGSAAASGDDARAVASALNEAFQPVARAIVAWTEEAM